MNNEIFEKKINDINNVIIDFLPERTDKNIYVYEAMKHSLASGGKRIRPMLLNETYIMFSKKEDKEVTGPFMAAIEMTHSYSLVHDDLPCMDDAKLRRGLPATHVVFGEAFGVLAGDALLHRAFEVISDTMQKTKDLDLLKRQINAFSVIAKKSGSKGMVVGQALDVFSEKNNEYEIKKDDLDYIYKGKTAALIEAALMTGAILAGAGKEEVLFMEEVGRCTGLAFQIKDDILDVTGSEASIGKDAGSDNKNNKKTYIDFMGIEASNKEAEKYTKKAIDILENDIECSNPYLTDLISFLVKRTY